MKIIYLITLFYSIFLSTIMYLFLHKKTKMNIRFLYIDNVVVILTTSIISFLFTYFLIDFLNSFLLLSFSIVLSSFSTITIGYIITMIRFWQTPNRKILAKDGEIISPADGNILYIKKIESGNTPIVIKRGLEATISEITTTELINQPSWLIGINMTPFDVHKNCAPIDGEVVLNKHIQGEFLSLKNPEALIRNERNTLVIKTEVDELFGIVQTASKRVKRIDSYVSEGKKIKQGEWYGMIRFGSQVDVIIPATYTIQVNIGDQVYAINTIIAKQC